MRLSIRRRGSALTAEQRARIVTRIRFALARASPHVDRADVTLAEVDGSNDGGNETCRIRVRGPEFRELIIEERDSDILVAVDVASSRAARTVLRAVDVLRLMRGTSAA